MKTDLTFFTNEPGSTLLDRFRKALAKCTGQAGRKGRAGREAFT
jgi:hypothetical protein